MMKKYKFLILSSFLNYIIKYNFDAIFKYFIINSNIILMYNIEMSYI